ncbi:MAG TPA: SGNH/GDSL hydrolase family protein, partial [Gemmatimonadaceae bacterium]|nr:SGNH/GDSL hydrolase family protein [Gemmatimonadaceae bacterium]
MSRTHKLLRGALLLGATGALVAGCNSDASVVTTTPANNIFQSYVALGNSITAGYESGGINDSTQRQSYAVLLARSMGTRFAYPALNMPGCPPPIANFQTQARVGGASSTGSTCLLRTGSSATATLNNVAVPGINSVDPTAIVGPDSNALTELFLGGKTMVRKALDAHPTFATVWVGNNDILSFAILGQPAGATPQTKFVQSYSAMINQLVAGAQGLKGVLIGVAPVSQIPVMFTARALQSQAFVGALDAATHKQIIVDPTTCTPTTNSLIGMPIVSAIASGQHPPIIECEKTPTPPLGDIFVLDAGEQAQVATIIA